MVATKYTMLMMLALLAAGASAQINDCPGGMAPVGGLIGVGPACVNAQDLVNLCTNNQANCCAVGPINAGVLGSLIGNIGNCGGPQDGGRRLKQDTINACPGGMAPVGSLIGAGPVCANLQRLVNICTDNQANCCAVGPINAGVLGNLMGNIGNCGGRK